MQAGGVLSYRPLFREPSTGDVASPPFGGGVRAQVRRSVRHQQAMWHPLLSGERFEPKHLSVYNLPLISGVLEFVQPVLAVS